MILRTTPLLLCISLAMPVMSLARPVVGQANTDTILRKSGKHLTKIKIVKLERDKITYRKGGTDPVTIDAILVTGYRFGAAPETFNRGQSAANRGSHAAAAKLFDDAAKATKVDAIKNAATFFSGRAFALAAAKDSHDA